MRCLQRVLLTNTNEGPLITPMKATSFGNKAPRVELKQLNSIRARAVQRCVKYCPKTYRTTKDDRPYAIKSRLHQVHRGQLSLGPTEAP
jgi:hypothetical protein